MGNTYRSGRVRKGPPHAHRKLRDDVLLAHVRPIDVVRPEYQHPVEVLAAVVEREQLADDFPAPIREPGIGDVGDHQRNVLRRGNLGGVLVHLRAGGDDQVAHPLGEAGVEHVHHALHRDFEDQLGPVVEELRPVDVGQMTDRLHPPGRPGNRGRIAYVADDQLDFVEHVAEPLGGSSRIVVEAADLRAVMNQGPNERAADEAGAAGDENLSACQLDHVKGMMETSSASSQSRRQTFR